MSGKLLISTSQFGAEDAEALGRLKEAGVEYILNPFHRRLTAVELIDLLDGAEYLIAGVEAITEEVFKNNPQLKLIVRCGTGMDNVDLQSARKYGVVVESTPEAPVLSVAELTMGLMLNVLRSISQSDRAIRSGSWPKPMGNLLTGKTVGILGLGRIGRKVVELLKPFSADILGYDIVQDEEFAGRHKIKFVSLDKIFQCSDVVTIHLPLNEQTRHLVDSGRLNLMKSKAVLINVARGGIMDEDALADCLKHKKISAAALDVFEQEPYQGQLTQIDNVVLTSHIGSYAIETRIQMENQAVDYVLEFIRTQEEQFA